MAEFEAEKARKIARFNSLMKAVHNTSDSKFSSQRRADGADAVLRDLGIPPPKQGGRRTSRKRKKKTRRRKKRRKSRRKKKRRRSRRKK